MAEVLYSFDAQTVLDERRWKSVGADTPITVLFTNNTPHAVTMKWIDYNGDLVEYNVLQAGEQAG